MPKAAPLPPESDQDSDTLRPIEPLADLTPPAPPQLGRKPELLWAAPASLLVDDTYQRDLNRRSFALIKKLVDNFAWRKMKPPIVVRVGRQLHVIDGQHTAIAAATLGVPEIPVFVVDAGTALERAQSFVAHNQDRLTMAPMDIYRAQLRGGDHNAQQVDRVLTDAGVRLKVISKYSKNQVGDTAAVSCIRQMVRIRGPVVATKVLQAFVVGARGPISTAEISAVECVLTMDPGVSIKDMGAAIKALGDTGVTRCQAQATTERVPTKVVLVREYRRLLKRAA